MDHCELQCSDGGRVVLSGQLTRNTVPAIWANRRNWLAGEQEALTVDLEGVEKVDSAGVAMLLQVKRALRNTQRDLLIVNANQQFKAMLKVSGVDALLTLGS
ncbi:STAS domain-containing protein [Pseudidiomarina donghaiensis]|jgi:anti-anti-sigma factor|uniref:Anti-sigma factor antagonist n=1 Tax=Pseudidiomarina donghaiensis TaxID=519452 RepID=A0A432XKB1_9GAMM|nr:STAS domain-containing protein [Pseudidiomarina donghaiensis]MBR9906855.1 STAS domain-containing protein [Gammaproteobacteria bacterium]RUO49150.1 anti-sigma factor antagonist [Pseudidiomarina donghaiensis]SFV20689.1 phospholipid transport system transporter-binding protein [Pseudidiomarina donghaiensis]